MENNLNDIQRIWQSQKSTDFDLGGLIQKMKNTERKQRLEWIIGLICTPITVMILVYVLPLNENVLGISTLLIISLAMAWVIWLNSKSLLRKTQNSELYSQYDYLEEQLLKLRLRGEIIQKHMITYGFLLALAINLGYLSVLEPLPLETRIAAHVGATIFITVIMWFTLRKKKRKFESESRPMIQKLEQLLQELKN